MAAKNNRSKYFSVFLKKFCGIKFKNLFFEKNFLLTLGHPKFVFSYKLGIKKSKISPQLERNHDSLKIYL